jgi:pimeloyl-ACP methyl ester carboxylesterase
MIESHKSIQLDRIGLGGSPVQVRSCGEGRPILLLHAGVADSRMWLPMMEKFQNSFRLIAPDLRGYGGSPFPNHPFAYHLDAGLLLDQLGIERAWIVGASFGARLALDFCLVFPKRVSGLILVSPVIGGFNPSQEIESFNQKEEALLEAGDIEGATELNMRVWLDGPQREPSEVDTELRTRVAKMQRRAFQIPIPEQIQFLSVDFSAIERLSEVACPTQVVFGDQDHPAVIEHAEFLAERFPFAELQHFPHTGHLLSMEDPIGFAQVVQDFIWKNSSNNNDLEAKPY